MRIALPSYCTIKVRQQSRFTVIDEGLVGGKAAQLMQKEDKILRSGMLVPETIVLASGFFERLRYDAETELAERELERTRGLVRPNTPGDWVVSPESCLSRYKRRVWQEEILWGRFGETESEVISAIREHWDWKGLTVRSSQRDESEGTGRYFSGFASGREPINNLIRKVIASSTDDDMAVIIQPIIGTHICDLGFMPLAAGCAYSTRLKNSGEGRLVLVNGLGTKAVQRGGDVHYFKDGKILRQTEVDPNPDLMDTIQENELRTIDPYAKSPYYIDLNLRELSRAKQRALEMLPRILMALEQETGCAQYIEFALNKEGIYCTQIADKNPIEDETFEFRKERVLVSTTYAHGTKRVELDALVIPEEQDLINSVRSVNSIEFTLQEQIRLADKLIGKGRYILAVGSDMLTRVGTGIQLDKKTISELGAMVIFVTIHLNKATVGEHIRNNLSAVPLMVVDYLKPIKKLPSEGKNGMQIIRGNFVFEVNEAMGRGQISMR